MTPQSGRYVRRNVCVCSFHGLYFNGGRAHYIIESKVQWKPFCRATQQYPQDDWLGNQGETLEKKLCLYVGLCLSVYLCLCFCYGVRV